jgi:hypothetical protein
MLTGKTAAAKFCRTRNAVSGHQSSSCLDPRLVPCSRRFRARATTALIPSRIGARAKSCSKLARHLRPRLFSRGHALQRHQPGAFILSGMMDQHRHDFDLVVVMALLRDLAFHRADIVKRSRIFGKYLCLVQHRLRCFLERESSSDEVKEPRAEASQLKGHPLLHPSLFARNASVHKSSQRRCATPRRRYFGQFILKTTVLGGYRRLEYPMRLWSF